MNKYIADLHLGHENIIRLCNRPFRDADEMNETLIANCIASVRPDDDLYIIGDLAYKSVTSPRELISKIPGRKHLIIGNHDGVVLKTCRDLFVEVTQMADINDKGRRVFLCHYPIIEWPGYFRGSIHVYGHIHNNTTNATSKMAMKAQNMYNAGADILGFTPRTLDELIRMNEEFKGKH